MPDLEKPRCGCAVTSLHGKVYVIGGLVGYKVLSSDEMFDQATNKWTPIPDMKEARKECAACAIGDKIFVMGGYNHDDNDSLSSVEVFDTITQECSSIPNMTTK